MSRVTQRKHLVIALPLLAAGLLAACSKAPEAEPQPRPVRLMTAGDSRFAPAMELSGEIRARVESGLGFRVPGKISARRVELGQRVKKGQELARIDPSTESLGFQAAQARVSSVSAERDLAAAEFKRFSDLNQKGYVSAMDFDRRRIALESAEAALRQAKADLDLAANRVSYSSLTADADGVVVGITADVGEVVSVGQPIIRIAQDGPLEVLVSIPEDKLDVTKVAQAEISLWAQPQQRYPAKLRELSAAADPTTRTFAARYSFLEPVRAAALGQTATLHLSLPARAAGVRVPTQAVVQDKGQAAVWVFDPKSSTMKRTPVVLVGVDGNNVLVNGLAAGAQIATAGVHVLAEGQKVRPMQNGR